MTTPGGRTVLAVAVVLLSTAGTVGQNTEDYVNFESPQTRPLALSPNGRLLYAVNTSDNRVSIFDTAQLRKIDEVPVGLEPVSVAQRPDSDEVWVVNHVSDSIDILTPRRGLRAGRGPRVEIAATIAVGDEPASVAFSPDGSTAYVTLSRPDELAIVDAGTRVVTERVSLATAPHFNGQDPRAIVVAPGDSTVYVTLFESGNRTRGAALPPDESPDNLGTIVFDAGLDDFDLHALAPDGSVLGRTEGLGTILTNLRVSPDGSRIYVTGWDARNLVRTVEQLDGRPVVNLLTIVDRETLELIDRIDLDAPTYSPQAAVAQPTDLEFDASGRVWITAQGNDEVIAVDRDGRQLDRLPTGRAPRGLVFDAVTERLYVFNRLSNDVTVIDTAARRVLATLEIGFDPTPVAVRDGRQFLYTAAQSRDGNQSCVACHVDGHHDNIVWDLGDVTDPKGPMMTQSLRGLRNNAPYHWRGERPTLLDFNGAFEDVFAGRRLSDEDNALMATYMESLEYPPNPLRRRDGSLTSPLAECGRQLFTATVPPDACPPPGEGERRATFPCVACHSFPDGTNGQIISRNVLFTHADMEVTQLRGLVDKVGFSHDGRNRTLVEFLSQSPPFQRFPEGDKRAMEAFMLEFDSGQHAAVGTELTLNDQDCGEQGLDSVFASELGDLERLAGEGFIDLVAFGRVKNLPPVQLRFDPAQQTFQLDRLSPATLTRGELEALACEGQANVTFAAWPAGTGSRSLDRDRDGLINGVERSGGTDPGAFDTDGDGIGDGEEKILGTDPRNPDTDRDGADDGSERFAGTDPLDPASVLRFVQMAETGGGVQLTWSTVFGRRYEIRTVELDRPLRQGDAFGLLHTTASPEDESPVGTERFVDEDPLPAGRIRYYRVGALPAGS